MVATDPDLPSAPLRPAAASAASPFDVTDEGSAIMSFRFTSKTNRQPSSPAEKRYVSSCRKGKRL